MGLEFLNPFLLAALGALAIPILLHAFSPRKAPKRPFGAIDFLIKTQKRLQQRFRFQKILLLLIRLLMVTLLVLLFARPQFVTALMDPSRFKPASRVLILDNSMSMAWSEDGRSLLVRAREEATRLLDGMGSGDNAAVLSSQTSRADATLEFSRDALKREIEAIDMVPTPTDFREAFGRAAELLSTSALEIRQIVLFTDLTRPGWDPSRTDFLSQARWKELGVELVLVDLSGGRPLPNLHVVGTKSEQTFFKGIPELRLDVDIRRTGDVTGAVQANARAAWWTDGKKILDHSLPPGTEPETTLNFSSMGDSPAAPTDPATQKKGTTGRSRIHLDGDPLEADNDYWFHLNRQRRLRVLLVDGDWQLNPYRSESFYLDKAMEPISAAGGVTAQTVPLQALEPSKLEEGWDVIFLLNPAGLSTPLQRALAEQVEKGAGLLIAAGDQMDPLQANSYLKLLMPHPLRGMKSYIEESETERADERPSIQTSGYAHPFFFGYDDTNLAGARFDRIMLVEEGLAPESVLLRFTNGLPFLIEKKLGEGRVLVMLSTVDRDWTNFPIKTSFLPFVDQVVRYLSGELEWPLPPAVVGRRIAARLLPLPVEPFDRIEIWNPSDLLAESLPASLLESESFLPDRPGFYSLRWMEGERVVKQLPLAVNVDPEESDTSPADLALLRPRLESAFPKLVLTEVEKSSGEKNTTTPAWLGQTVRNRSLERTVLQAFLGFLVLLFLAESFILRRTS